MALRRREALVLTGVAVAAAAAGFLVGPKLLRGTSGGAADALRTVAIPDLSGQVRRFSDWDGKALVINFWATWCPPCLEEIPMLVAARERYLADGVEFVGIAVDNAAKVSEFTRKIPIGYPILVADASGLDLMRRLGNKAGGLPYTVLLGRQRSLVKQKLGAMERPELDRMIAAILSE